MNPALDAYERAREQLLDAEAGVPGEFIQAPGEELPPEIVAHVEATEAFRAAEAELADQVQAAWERNLVAYRDAKAAVAAALRAQAVVETECGNAARLRNPRFPVLTEAEKQRVTAARDVVTATKTTLEAAAEVVKAGVTADQIAEVG